ncbi:MAG TPA: fatty acid cis/trans isomerase [Burkholderiaceae bacterium]|nr:fatty acid cis/trans isomerase [Burkholderiaceae bacterium]HMX11035.1 fatty acid cis/trans isomerase [Burkholderiaceae bacterium]HMY99505.1 fatty acid cis/trans isomerase [Burkholderiaceae bacterium]HNB44365.1 fatty acid cis/trans isomerase [Burkholderiaceae bacterium]HNG80821.1 fatty acid cis/trans isomerase [Burkholderiaceae bacterium]
MRRPRLDLPLLLLAALTAAFVLAGLTGFTLPEFRPASLLEPKVSTRLDQAPLPAAGEPTYRRDIKPLLDRRCVVCHGCYDAPCQLKLQDWAGIARGVSKDSVYASIRLEDAPTTRLGIDAQRASEWRRRGFSPVLNEQAHSPERALSGSLLWQALLLKSANPLPDEKVLTSGDFDFSLDRSQSCPNRDAYDEYARDHPLAGMPYGLRGLEPAQLQTISRWLQAGAPDEPPEPLPVAIERQLRAWEAFLNADGLKAQLVGRYLYEHLFLGHLEFEGDPGRHHFKLVRSATPPGQPLRILPTRRPYDEPGVERPWYRIVLDGETVLAKTHMPYLLSPARLARWRTWFVDARYEVEALPDYRPENASNPFRTFAALPMASRYRFLLDDAGFFVMNFIKGPVCRGQIALDVIHDQFWVFFVDPAIGASDDAAQLVAREGEVIRLPAAAGANASLLAWRDIARAEDRLRAVKSAALASQNGPAPRIDLNFVWSGNGHNRNAALTVFRHFDSASVVQGLVGPAPRSAWVIGYPLLERIYYLLVAGYDVYGNTAHQLQTRLAMDFLRMEGEANFLLLLPRAERLALRDEWYRGVSEEVKQRVLGGPYRSDVESGIRIPAGADARQHLYGLLRQRLAPVLAHEHDLGPMQVPDAREREALHRLGALTGSALQWWPEAAMLIVEPVPTAGGEAAPASAAHTYSLLRNTAHRNVSTLFLEKKMLIPAENTLTVAAGFIGAYPNAVLRLRADELPDFAAALAGLRSEADYRRLADRWGVRRSDARFWATSDALMDAYQRWAPGEAGLLDLSRLENR